jgi:hypothetical protein
MALRLNRRPNSLGNPSITRLPRLLIIRTVARNLRARVMLAKWLYRMRMDNSLPTQTHMIPRANILSLEATTVTPLTPKLNHSYRVTESARSNQRWDPIIWRYLMAVRRLVRAHPTWVMLATVRLLRLSLIWAVRGMA